MLGQTGAEWWPGWTKHPVVTHGLIPAGKGHGESPTGGSKRGALGVTSPLNGVPCRQLFTRLLQKGFGSSLSLQPSACCRDLDSCSVVSRSFHSYHPPHSQQWMRGKPTSASLCPLLSQKGMHPGAPWCCAGAGGHHRGRVNGCCRTFLQLEPVPSNAPGLPVQPKQL